MESSSSGGGAGDRLLYELRLEEVLPHPPDRNPAIPERPAASSSNEGAVNEAVDVEGGDGDGKGTEGSKKEVEGGRAEGDGEGRREWEMRFSVLSMNVLAARYVFSHSGNSLAPPSEVTDGGSGSDRKEEKEKEKEDGEDGEDDEKEEEGMRRGTGKPEWFLHWEHRCKLVMKIITQLRPDIVCLQEVDRYDDLRPPMKELGYESFYKRRTRRRKDGCATFWKADKFKLATLKDVELNNINPKMVGVDKMRLRRDTIGLVTIFEPQDYKPVGEHPPAETPNSESASKGKRKGQPAWANRKLLVVANTHLYWRPTYEDVKLLQAYMLAQALQTFCRRKQFTKGLSASLVFCGDFNSLPATVVYDYLTRGSITADGFRAMAARCDHPPPMPPYLTGAKPAAPSSTGNQHHSNQPRKAGRGRATKAKKKAKMKKRLYKPIGWQFNVEHFLRLLSAYGDYQPPTPSSPAAPLDAAGSDPDAPTAEETEENVSPPVGEPPFTNYTSNFKGCLDYIFFSNDLERIERLVLPTEQELKAKGVSGLPCESFPSDHLPLLCRFRQSTFEENKPQDSKPA